MQRLVPSLFVCLFIQTVYAQTMRRVDNTPPNIYEAAPTAHDVANSRDIIWRLKPISSVRGAA